MKCADRPRVLNCASPPAAEVIISAEQPPPTRQSLKYSDVPSQQPPAPQNGLLTSSSRVGSDGETRFYFPCDQRCPVYQWHAAPTTASPSGPSEGDVASTDPPHPHQLNRRSRPSVPAPALPPPDAVYAATTVSTKQQPPEPYSDPDDAELGSGSSHDDEDDDDGIEDDILWRQMAPLAADNPAVADLLGHLRYGTSAVWDRACGAFQASFPAWYFKRLSSKALRDVCRPSPEAASEPLCETVDLVPCVFTWSHGGHSVDLVGSFTGWSAEKVRMARSGHEFVAIKELPRGLHYYKFIVDDQWRFTPNQPTRTDAQGNVNNVLDISDYQSYNFTVPKENEKARVESYAQFVPGASDYTTDAPVIPVLLSKSNCVAAEPQTRISAPLHVLANHVYHDSHSASLFGPHITSVTSTQRWRHAHKSPYSTAGQRFSTVTYVTFNPLFPCHGDPVFEIQAASHLRGIVGSRTHCTAPEEGAEFLPSIPLQQPSTSSLQASSASQQHSRTSRREAY